MSARAHALKQVQSRFANTDSARLEQEISTNGYAVIPGALDRQECTELRSLYEHTDRFRNRVVMARHNFGQGEYQYFKYPLPPLIDELRHDLYPLLAPVANAWSERLSIDARYPASLDEFLKLCHRAGQTRPTPLLLKYAEGDYNRLHQDLYGATQFPLQATILLSRPGDDFDGGEFVLVESAPRTQSRAEIVPLSEGDMVVFAVNARPVASTRGFKRVALRHGVARVRAGHRMTLGLIFHDAA